MICDNATREQICTSQTRRGPAAIAILFISCDACSDSITKLFRACSKGVSNKYHPICCRIEYRASKYTPPPPLTKFLLARNGGRGGRGAEFLPGVLFFSHPVFKEPKVAFEFFLWRKSPVMQVSELGMGHRSDIIVISPRCGHQAQT